MRIKSTLTVMIAVLMTLSFAPKAQAFLFMFVFQDMTLSQAQSPKTVPSIAKANQIWHADASSAATKSEPDSFSLLDKKAGLSCTYHYTNNSHHVTQIRLTPTMLKNIKYFWVDTDQYSPKSKKRSFVPGFRIDGNPQELQLRAIYTTEYNDQGNLVVTDRRIEQSDNGWHSLNSAAVLKTSEINLKIRDVLSGCIADPGLKKTRALMKADWFPHNLRP
jgi:hypothetical protein